jgi:hypothetical protein
LAEAIVNERRRSYNVPQSLHTGFEPEELAEAITLAGTLLTQYRVSYLFEDQPGWARLRLTYGGLDEDVGEWLAEIVDRYVQQARNQVMVASTGREADAYR